MGRFNRNRRNLLWRPKIPAGPLPLLFRAVNSSGTTIDLELATPLPAIPAGATITSFIIDSSNNQVEADATDQASPNQFVATFSGGTTLASWAWIQITTDAGTVEWVIRNVVPIT